MAFGVNGKDITVNRFDYGVNLVWTFKDVDGSDFELSGYNVQFIIKKEKYQDDTHAIFETTVAGDGNKITIPLTEEITSNPVDTYHYALRLVQDGVFVDTVLSAKFIISCNTFESEA